MADGVQGGFGAGDAAQLAIDIADMILYGSFGQNQVLGNCSIVEALSQQREDFYLTGGK